MKIAIACDHRGYEAKRRLRFALEEMGHEVTDFGSEGSNNCDYPDFGLPAARAVADGECEIGVLLDGSGIGMSVVANKVKGVIAALAHDVITARRAREQNHCNVLCLGADLLSEEEIRQIVQVFLETAFEDGRHARRIEKIRRIEEGYL